MKRNINERLRALEARRTGGWTYSAEGFVMDSATSERNLEKSLTEAYVKRAGEKPNTQWVLGAMQAVGKPYTDICIKEAERVGKQLHDGLAKRAIEVEFRLQGSVPCDIHIRSTSDVDLLVISKKFFRYSSTGLRAKRGDFNNPVDYDTLKALVKLRNESEDVLRDAFPAATVETGNSKAIALSGGSLQRKVDAVPANWYDSDQYQESGNLAERGIEILNKAVPERITNFPFKHIEQLHLADEKTNGGLKKAIRLLKSIKANSEEEGEEIKLSSYDIASFMWHADRGRLAVESGQELKLLAEISNFISYLLSNREWAKGLKTPNGNDTIFSSDSKFDGLTALSSALNEIAVEVAMENPSSFHGRSYNVTAALDELKKAYIPA